MAFTAVIWALAQKICGSARSLIATGCPTIYSLIEGIAYLKLLSWPCEVIRRLKYRASTG
jgi:hypothetical protein